MMVLGIETSCDETAAAVVEDGKRILSNVVSSSVEFHKEYGGVVPEIACRLHVELIEHVVDKALRDARVSLNDMGAVAVTYGPGLVGALIVGVMFAKAISFACKIPLVKVNHLRAHLYVDLMTGDDVEFPYVGLIVSGGHTNLVYVKDVVTYEPLGQTTDDAAGEAFDKVAKILNLGYPGGPVIDRLSGEGDPSSVQFPRAYLGEDSLNFSFSGLKTAVLYYVRRSFTGVSTVPSGNPIRKVSDICASFQEAVVDVLVRKSLMACLNKNVTTLVVGGGVSANSRLRRRLNNDLAPHGIKVYFPPGELCVDNGAMVAGIGYRIYEKGIIDVLSLTAEPGLGIEG
jgi:N6-L-threonylcarbamoyladenine synthase